MAKETELIRFLSGGYSSGDLLNEWRSGYCILYNIDLTTFYYVTQNINNPKFTINFPTDEK